MPDDAPEHAESQQQVDTPAEKPELDPERKVESDEVAEPSSALTREKHDEPKPDPPEADDFGLPVRPPRRRQYSLEGLDSPEDIKKQVIEDLKGKVEQEDHGAEPAEQAEDKEAAGASETTKTAPNETEVTDKPAADSLGSPRTSTDAKDSSADPKSPSSPKTLPSPEATKHTRAKPSVSEWSHQVTAPKEEPLEEVPEDDGDWQAMPAFATHTIYDDWGKVLAKDYSEVQDESVAYGTLGGAGKGYTRVQMDEDAQSATSMDDNTAYLFNDTHPTTTLYEEDEDARDLLSQMKMTKELLTESQRVAYVGLVRLSLVTMAQDVQQLQKNRHTKKAVDLATEGLKMWAQKVMFRLYAHMDLAMQEQVMIEQLSEHGVLPSDLTPQLMANARLKSDKAASKPSSTSSSARPSTSSPRPSNVAEKRLSNNLSAPPTPGALENPPPTYTEHTADELTIEDPADIEDAKSLELDIRWTVLCDLFLLLVADSSYDARSRTLLEHVGSGLAVEWQEICRFEKRVTDALEMQEQAEKENWNEEAHLEARKQADRKRRLLVMGLCTVGGGLVIGLSAGVLAPVIGAGLATGFTAIGITGTGTFLGGAGAAALIGTGGSLIGGGIGLKTSNRRTGAVKTYEYKPLYNNKRVNLIVTVAGWMTGKVDDVRLPFSTVDPIMGDIYSINWEPEMLQSTGQTIQILATEALTQTIQQILGATILATLMAGLSTPIVLAKISYLIDNPWTVSLARADATGLIFADSLIDRNLGLRPITLVGFSLGSRVIFSCLKELARRGAIGLIQNVYMFGSPVVANTDEYVRARSIVSGRFVNGYATNDWILGYLFRATSGGIRRVSGLASVNVNGIENIDVTEHVPGHMAYRGMMPTLLHEVGWQVESLEFSEIEDPDPDNHEKRQRELLNEIEEARKQMDEQPQKRGFKSFFSRRKAPQKKVWETYDERSARVLEGDEKESERVAEENANVLFDVEAIRREALALATQHPNDLEEIKAHLSVREIQSTLPMLKVTMSNDQQNGIPSSAASSSRPEIRQTKSHSGTSLEQRQNGDEVLSPRSNGVYPHSEGEGESEVTLSFESPERPKGFAPDRAGNDSPAFTNSPALSARPSAEVWSSPGIPEHSWDPQSSPSPRPVPSISKVDKELPPSPPAEDNDHGHNPWAHGEMHEGEQEMEMSFE